MEQKQHSGFPWNHLLGFIMSILLTFAAVVVALHSELAKPAIFIIIIVLAVIQGVLQLVMFMHLTESENKRIQVINMIYSFFVAIIIVAGSVWVMYFGVH